MRALVTGSAGFVGRHLIAWLAQSDWEIWGIDRVMSNDSKLGSRFLKIELSDANELEQAIKRVRPTHVFHLAGVLGNASYEELYKVNVLSTIHLFEALYHASCTARIIIAGSSAVYGNTPPELNPLGEEHSLVPISHYGGSKLAQENVGRQYCYANQMPVVIARSFNLLGPDLSPILLASSLARQIAQVELGWTSSPIQVGNLWPRRDYVDVRDVVQAYTALASAGLPDSVYNVCSGRSYSVQNCLDVLVKLARCPIQVSQDPERMRSNEIIDQVGDPTRLYSTTGWQPVIGFEQSLSDLLDGWRIALAKEKRL